MNYKNILKAAMEFDDLFFRNAPFSDFCKLFDLYGRDCPEIFEHMITRDLLFNADFLVQCNKAHLYAIRDCMKINETAYKVRIATRIVLDQKIPSEIRAFFWEETQHEIKYWGNEKRLAREVLLDNYDIMSVMKENGIGTPVELKFLNDISSFNFRRAETYIFNSSRRNLKAALDSDSIASFEINREFLGSEIGTTMIDCLLVCGAVQIFFYLLNKHPRKFLNLRTKENWLFAIVKNSSGIAHLAGGEKESVKRIIGFLKNFECYDPGIIARVRDPWDNNLLWYVPFRYNCRDIYKCLVDLGCNPEWKNKFGLSRKLISENSRENYENEFDQKYPEHDSDK